jgi:RimJ/RimL family protein N-acetyltransferase
MNTTPLAATTTPTIRAVTAADAAAMSAFLVGLDAGSRRLRFHGALNPRSEALLRRLTEVDGWQHAAWIAAVRTDCGSEQVVGEARCVRDGTGGAELAMSVATAWRGRGVADQLLATLTLHARQAGLHHLVADVMDDNGRMLAFMQRHGYTEALGHDTRFEADAGSSLRLMRTLTPQRHESRQSPWLGVAGWVRRGVARLVSRPVPA